MSVEEHLERARQWLEAAGNDLQSAEVLRQAGIFNNACFFAQQAAEKAFKGFLVATGVDCPRSHSLDSLVALVPADERLSKLSPARLDRYYIAPRYPDALPPGGSILKSYGSPDADDAIHTAQGIVDLMKAWTKDYVDAIASTAEAVRGTDIEAELGALQKLVETLKGEGHPHKCASSPPASPPAAPPKGPGRRR
jgi:HEPN domain-containing protein